jgi:hypothetical protein
MASNDSTFEQAREIGSLATRRLVRRLASVSAVVVCLVPALARADCPGLIDNDLFNGGGPQPRQTSLVQDDATGAAEKVLNFRVLLRDDSMPAAGIAPAGPISALDQDRYCAIVNEWSRLTYVSTEGVHRIGTVTFYYGESMNWPEADNTEVDWFRWWAPGDGTNNWRVSGGGSNFAKMYAYDDAIGCILLPGLNENGDLVGLRPCVDWSDVAAELTCEDHDLTGLPAKFCVDPALNLPILRTPAAAGWVFAHENAHFFYGADDEYDNEHGLAVCLGEYSAAEYDETSMMATHGRDRFCDSESHLTVRQLPDPDAPTVEVCNRVEQHAWSVLEANWAELQGVHEDGEHPNIDTSDLPAVECVFEFTPVNDYVLLLDRSFSMASSTNAGTGQNAFETARDAAVGLYNEVPEDAESSAVYTYNTNVQKPIPYGPRSSVIEPEGPELGPIGPNGNTDICKAIRAAADDINAENPGAGLGMAVLLSDGLPTVAACDTTAEVLDAAEYACSRPVPVRLHTLAFGDADHELLQQVAQTCGGTSYSTQARAFDFSVAPEQLKFDLSRLGYSARAFTPIVEQRQLLTPLREQLVYVPPGARELDVAWVGDGYAKQHTTGGGVLACSFHQLKFELHSPSGALHLPAAAATPEGAAGRNAQFMNVRLSNPETGFWRMRLDASGFPCKTPGGALGDPFTSYRPRIQWLAGMRHHALRAVADAQPTVAPRDASVVITTELFLPEPFKVAPLIVTGQVHHIGTATPIMFRDDGVAPDVVAADGTYSALFNPTGSIVPAGFYEVTARLVSFPGLSHALPGEVEHLELSPSDPVPVLPDPGYAEVIARTSFVLRPCCEKGATAACVQCDTAPCSSPGFSALEPGARYTGLTVATNGFKSSSSGLELGLGAGVRISNLRYRTDPRSGAGTATFDAEVSLNASPGPRTATLRDRHRRCRTAPDAVHVRARGGASTLQARDAFGAGVCIETTASGAD